VHAAEFCRPGQVMILREEIGPHNALDRSRALWRAKGLQRTMDLCC
jgi:formate dehydrogenase assembly factor FdhD